MEVDREADAETQSFFVVVVVVAGDCQFAVVAKQET